MKCYPWLSDSQSKFQSYSTNLHPKHYHCDNKKFLENFPVLQEYLYCVANRYKIDPQFHIQRLNLLQDYLLLFGNFTPVPQICTCWATNLAKNIFEESSQFSRKIYIVWKIWTEWFCWDFEVLPPDYVTINQNLSPIPQIYTPNSTILTEKNFWKISQFSRKTYIVCKIWTKMVLLGIWSLTPWFCDNQSKFQSYSTNLDTGHYHSYQTEFLENFPVFQKNLHCMQNLDKNSFAEILKSYPLIMWQSIKISVLFHQSAHQALGF